jgi:hypothetical protein
VLASNVASDFTRQPRKPHTEIPAEVTAVCRLDFCSLFRSTLQAFATIRSYAISSTTCAASCGLMNDPGVPPVVQLGAANALADRGFGRPMQNATQRIIRHISDLSDDELNAILASGEAEEDLPLH